MYEDYIITLQCDSNFFIDYFVPFIALILSLVAIIFSIRVVYITKRLDVKQKQYEELCLNPVNAILTKVEVLFTCHESEKVKKFIEVIPTTMTNFQVYVFELSTIYKEIDKQELVRITEVFSDKLFENPNNPLSAHMSDYYKLKLQVFTKLYDYVIKKEIKIIPLRSK